MDELLKNGPVHVITLDEIIDLAEDEIVVLRKPDGSVFALSPVDELLSKWNC